LNILLECSTHNYKTYYWASKVLDAHFLDSKFSVIYGSHEKYAYELFSQSSNPFFNIYDSFERRKRSLGYRPDYEVLREFDSIIADASLWEYVAADRNLGEVFIHGGVRVGSLHRKKMNKNDILGFLTGEIVQIEKIFKECSPDIFIPAIAMGNVSLFVYEGLCKKYNVKYIYPTVSRVKNYMTFSNNVNLLLPDVDRAYQEAITGIVEFNSDSGEELYDELMLEVEDPQYFDRLHAKGIHSSIGNKISGVLDEFKGFADFLYLYSRSIYLLFLEYVRLKISRDVISSNLFKAFISRASYFFQDYVQKRRLLNPGFGEILEPGQKYLYYPLQTIPEYATSIQGAMWVDQLHNIELLAKSIPIDWVVYVKEHPSQLVDRVRPIGFYDKIRNIPNVKLAPITADMHSIISNAEMVAVITGTSGWEAIQRGVPVISFVKNFWDVLDLSCVVSDVNNLSRDIVGEIDRIKKISIIERKRRLVCYYSLLLKVSYDCVNPIVMHYYTVGSDAEHEELGEQLGKELIVYVENMRADKS